MVRSGRKVRKILITLVIIGLVALVLFLYRDLKRRRDSTPQTAVSPTGSPTVLSPEALPSKPSSKVPPGPLPRMANLPPKPKPTPPPPPPTYPPDAPVLERVRKALGEGIDPAEALTLAKSLPESPERADAGFLLLEYAADSGNAEAALAVASYYDPAYEGPSGSIHKNPETAYEWYQEALDGGEKLAENHLAELRRWLEEQAAQGSRDALELLKNWD